MYDAKCTVCFHYPWNWNSHRFQGNFTNHSHMDMQDQSISHTSLLWTCWGSNIAFVWQCLDVGIACRTILPELRLWFCTRSIIPMMWCFTFYKSRGLNACGWHVQRQQKHHRLMMVLDIWSSYTVTVALPWSLTCLYLQITGDSALYLSAWILNEVWLLTGQAVLG